MKQAGGLRSLAFVPLILAAISIPLALGMVEPNPFYGVRIAATRASEAAWYRANHASGVAGVVGGLAGFALNLRVLRSSMPPLRKVQACLGGARRSGRADGPGRDRRRLGNWASPPV